MLTVNEATQIILDALQPLPTEIIPFAETLGRVLADDLGSGASGILDAFTRNRRADYDRRADSPRRRRGGQTRGH